MRSIISRITIILSFFSLLPTRYFARANPSSAEWVLFTSNNFSLFTIVPDGTGRWYLFLFFFIILSSTLREWILSTLEKLYTALLSVHTISCVTTIFYYLYIVAIRENIWYIPLLSWVNAILIDCIYLWNGQSRSERKRERAVENSLVLITTTGDKMKVSPGIMRDGVATFGNLAEKIIN